MSVVLCANTLTQFVISRLRRDAYLPAAQDCRAQKRGNRQIATRLRWVTDEISKQLAAMNAEIQVFYADDQPIDDSNAIFERIENGRNMNFIVCDAKHPAWARHCIASRHGQ